MLIHLLADTDLGSETVTLLASGHRSVDAAAGTWIQLNNTVLDLSITDTLKKFFTWSDTADIQSLVLVLTAFCSLNSRKNPSTDSKQTHHLWIHTVHMAARTFRNLDLFVSEPFTQCCKIQHRIDDAFCSRILQCISSIWDTRTDIDDLHIRSILCSEHSCMCDSRCHNRQKIRQHIRMIFLNQVVDGRTWWCQKNRILIRSVTIIHVFLHNISSCFCRFMHICKSQLMKGCRHLVRICISKYTQVRRRQRYNSLLPVLHHGLDPLNILDKCNCILWTGLQTLAAFHALWSNKLCMFILDTNGLYFTQTDTFITVLALCLSKSNDAHP